MAKGNLAVFFTFWLTSVIAARDTPFFSPGPGLPSLESLNLTYTDLVNMPTPEWAKSSHSAKLHKRTPSCAIAQRQCQVKDAVICYNFLMALDTTPCTIAGSGGDQRQFCYSGDCEVYGTNVGPQVGVSSFCRDIAYPVSTVAYGCGTTPGWAGAGFDAAGGNGYMFVTLTRKI